MAEKLYNHFLGKKLIENLPFQISIFPEISPIITTVIILGAILFIFVAFIFQKLISKVNTERKKSLTLENKPNRVTKFVELHLHLDGSITLDIA